MTRLAFLSETRGGIGRGAAPAAPPSQTILELLDDLTLVSHWRLNEATGQTFADRMAVSNMTVAGNPQRLTTTIVDNDISSACIGLNGLTNHLQAPNPAAKPYDVTSGAMGVFIQPDTVAPTKQQIMNRAAVGVAGAMALELLSGGQVRCFRRDGGGTQREILSSIGVAPAGDACLLLMSWGPDGLKLYRDGTPLAPPVAITDWAVDAALSASVALGIWPLTNVDPFDGVMAHAFFLGAQPSDFEVLTLAHALSIAWAEDIDVGSVAVSTTETISLKTALAHFKAPIVPEVLAQGELGTSSINGEAIDYEAAGVTGFNDEVSYRFTSANNAVSAARTILIDVTDDVQFPLTLPFSVGWFSTTRSSMGSPSHGTAIENLTNVADAATLFTQASAPLRGTWDSQTLDVPVVRGDGTQHYTRPVALPSLGLGLVCGIIDPDAGAVFRAFTGARSTQTPGGSPTEDAWTINKTQTGTMRALVAATGGISFTDVPERLGEKLLILMRVENGVLTMWQNGIQSVPQTISGARIASDGEQALLAKYFNDAITAIMKGGIHSFKQYSTAATPAQERQLIEYFQGEWWPSVTPPSTATLAAGDIAQGATLDFDVIAQLSALGINTTGMILASIHEQPTLSGVTVSVAGGVARIAVAAGATLGDGSFVYCVQQSTGTDRLVAFGTTNFAVAQTSSTTVGITVPAFAGQTITDPVPSGAIWLDPTNGSDSNNGSTKALAKKTPAAAEAIMGAGGTIVAVGGHHTVPEFKPITSGTSGNPRKLMAEPGTTVWWYRTGEFRGGVERTWTWTLIDAGRQIWESPALGIGDGATVVNRASNGAGNVTNGFKGFIRIPSGAHGVPHLMQMYWYGGGTYAPDSFTHSNTGANAGKFIDNGGYGGPGLYSPGNGKIRIRMQKVTSPYSGAQWPTDGRMGTLIGSNGLWQEPITENPNDYEIHIQRFDGDAAANTRPVLFNMNGQSWWHIKGINGALMNQAVDFPANSRNNLFEKCTFYPHTTGMFFTGATNGNRFLRCRILTGDNRHLSWREHKTPNFWWQHGRSTLFAYNDGGGNANVMKDLRFEHCTMFGWFDLGLPSQPPKTAINTTVVLDHCAFLNTGDDGFMQRRTDEEVAFDSYYSYYAGGPCWSSENNQSANGKHGFWHHNVIDLRIPMLWTPLGETGTKRGVGPNFMAPIHGGSSVGPVTVRKFYYNTIVHSPDGTDGNTIIQGTSSANHNVPAGLAHEVFNNIFVVRDNKRYPDGSQGDQVAFRLSCRASTAGIHRYDYNCYHRDVPNPISPLFKQIQESRNVLREDFTSLAAFRASGKRTLSHSMYSDGTQGHEQHGVQVDPGFVNLGARDYRPTHPNVRAGAKDLTATGYPGTGTFENWKGACDPNGNGSEVGPQNP